MEAEMRIRVTPCKGMKKKIIETLEKIAIGNCISDITVEEIPGPDLVLSIVGHSSAEWGDVRDYTSDSGTKGGWVESFDNAECEVHEVLVNLYNRDLIEDWNTEKYFPEYVDL